MLVNKWLWSIYCKRHHYWNGLEKNKSHGYNRIIIYPDRLLLDRLLIHRLVRKHLTYAYTIHHFSSSIHLYDLCIA